MNKTTFWAAILLCGLFRAGFGSDLMGNPDESWDPGPPESHFASVADERFEMECDYLGIGGDRKDKARKSFEELKTARERVIRERDSGRLSRTEAIARFDSLDLDYYMKLRGLVKGEKKQERLERMIRKAGKRNSDIVSVLDQSRTKHVPGR